MVVNAAASSSTDLVGDAQLAGANGLQTPVVGSTAASVAPIIDPRLSSSINWIDSSLFASASGLDL